MALSHILSAITAETDNELMTMRSAHASTVKEMEEKHQQNLATIKSTVAQQKTQRLHQLKKRTEGHIEMMTRHAVLRRKQELLNELFAEVTSLLGSLPAAEAEKMFGKWITALPEGGTVIPSKKHEALVKKLCGSHQTVAPAEDSAGGFRYVGKREDRNYTFEFLVHHILRPALEIEAANQLFGSR